MRKQKTKKNWSLIICTIVMIFVLTIASIEVYFLKTTGKRSINGWQVGFVLTDSMYPTIKPRSLILETTDVSDLKVGDIASYYMLYIDGKYYLTTHRIYSISDDGLYTFKGDNLDTPDGEAVDINRIIYKVV